VGLGDFDVKSQIGNGYFGEVHVSQFYAGFIAVITYHTYFFFEKLTARN
jgi:hypothetical protein